MKLLTYQKAASRVFLRRFPLFAAAALLVLTPAFANTIKVPEAPGATNAGDGPADSSTTLTSRTSTLTTELLDVMTAAQTKNGRRDVSEEYFTLDTARSWGARSYSPSASSDVQSNGRAISVVDSTSPNFGLVVWAHTNHMSNSNLNYPTSGEALQTQMMIGGTVDDKAPKHSKQDASKAGNDRYNPFVQGKSEFTLSVVGSKEATYLRDFVLSPDGKGDGEGSPSAAIEPRFNSLLLFAGMMTALLVYRRRSRAA